MHIYIVNGEIQSTPPPPPVPGGPIAQTVQNVVYTAVFFDKTYTEFSYKLN